jgi:hypothetical protein
MDKPTKKGKLDEIDSNKPILINDKGRCFVVTKPIANVWKKLDGTKTVKNIADEISETKPVNPIALETAIEEIVSKLKEYDLVK